MNYLARDYALLLAAESDIRDHLPYFVELAGDATTVIELGVRTGVSTRAWLYGLEGHGHLWSVDINPFAMPYTVEHFTFVQGDDLFVADQLPDDVDVVFIDTSHHYVRTLRELDVYVPKVRPGGLVVLHDTELEYPEDAPRLDPAFPVKTAIADFCTMHDFKWTNRTNCYGLATIEVV